MKAAVTVLCALLGVPGGMLANHLVDRIPEKRPLRPFPGARDLAGSRVQVISILVTVALFAGTALRFGADWVVPAYLVFFVCLVSVTVIDAERQIIPNYIVYPTIFTSVPLLALAALLQDEWDRFGQSMLGATLGFLALAAIWAVYPAGMGFGDVRLAFVLGLFLGWISLSHVLAGMFLGVALIAVIGILLALLSLKNLQDHIAFGPFLAAGSTLAVFAGEPMIRWWTG
jgi:leader peptidase (prepilin peptidase) / N-methyltransferase